ncbi:MAG: hypothetical protein MI974_32030 [Chitinophagales bacterium]|nr:hypothetical protein [Chitinophagales bacterium]
MGKSYRIKSLKDGNLQLQFPEDVWSSFYFALWCLMREEGDKMEEYEYALFTEVKKMAEEPSKTKKKMRPSQYFALMHRRVIRHLDQPTQILLNDALPPKLVIEIG